MNNELIARYKENENFLKDESSDLMNSVREKAFQQFQKLGLPDKNGEDYRYIELEKLFQGNFSSAFKPQKLSVDFSSLFQCNVPDLDSYIVLLVNGWYYYQNIKLDLPDGVLIGSLREMAKKHP